MNSITLEKQNRTIENSEKERTRRIIKWIRYRDATLRRKFSFLKQQDTIGLSITIGSALGIVLFAGLFILGFIPFWICIIVNAILASFLHEIEHDTIHNLYFKQSPRMQNFIFWIVWLFRLNVVNPWFRKEIHLLHHKLSGNQEDIEERFISNGMPFGWKRFLTQIDPIMALIIQGPKIAKDAMPYFRKIKAPHRVGIIREIYLLAWYTFLGWSLFSMINRVIGFPVTETGIAAKIHTILNMAAVVYMIPAWIRQTSIQIVSSNMHYYGNVDSLYRQTQVLDSWMIFPLHLFCFNFGATHGIHHFVVSQPFYLRQATAFFVRPALKKYGIHFNDFASMFHSNRYVTGTPG